MSLHYFHISYWYTFYFVFCLSAHMSLPIYAHTCSDLWYHPSYLEYKSFLTHFLALGFFLSDEINSILMRASVTFVLGRRSIVLDCLCIEPAHHAEPVFVGARRSVGPESVAPCKARIAHAAVCFVGRNHCHSLITIPTGSLYTIRYQTGILWLVTLTRVRNYPSKDAHNVAALVAGCRWRWVVAR